MIYGRSILRFAHIYLQIFYFWNSVSYFISSAETRFYNTNKFKKFDKIVYHKHEMWILFCGGRFFKIENCHFFSLLMCKQYCWFEFLFFHAGCTGSYFDSWNIWWRSQIICKINFYEFDFHIVTNFAISYWACEEIATYYYGPGTNFKFCKVCSHYTCTYNIVYCMF